MKEKDFSLPIINDTEEFKRVYENMQNYGNSRISLLSHFDYDTNFIQAFQNEFIQAPKSPDVSKYWQGLFSKEKIDEYFLIKSGALKNKTTTLTETILLEKRKDFSDLVLRKEAPKECYTYNIEETNIYKQFRIIEDTLNRFKEMEGFDNSVNNLLIQAEEFARGLICEIENVNYKPIRNKIIDVIINDKENMFSFIKGFNNNNFNNKKFNDDYAKAKMYLDNHLRKYLDTQLNIFEESVSIKTPLPKITKKEEYLFEIGLKLALGELNEYLITKDCDVRKSSKKSYKKLANEFQLNEQYLKSTLGNYQNENALKNLKNNKDIIDRVLTHLKSECKEPEEWFLKVFK